MENASRTTVLIADDHAVWRRGLRDVLEPAFKVVSEACDGDEAVQQTLALRPDVVILDIDMPRTDGITAARRIKEAAQNTAVVVISATDRDAEIQESIRVGASAYVVKDDLPENICQAVGNAAEGKAYLAPTIAKRVLAGVADVMNGVSRGTRGGTLLTPREISVLRLLAEGYRYKQIARELFISERTVGNHIASIYNKLGVFDRAQAITYAIKQGIVRI